MERSAKADWSKTSRELNNQTRNTEQRLSEKDSEKGSKSGTKGTGSDRHDTIQRSSLRKSRHHRDGGTVQHGTFIASSSIDKRFFQGDSVQAIEPEEKVSNAFQVSLHSRFSLQNVPREPSLFWSDLGNQTSSLTNQDLGTPLMPSYRVEREGTRPRILGRHYQSSNPHIQHEYCEITPTESAAAGIETNSMTLLHKKNSTSASKEWGECCDSSQSRSLSATIPTERKKTPSNPDSPSTYVSRHHNEPSRIPKESKSETMRVNGHSLEVDYDDDDCGSLDDESIDGDLSRFEDIRRGLGGNGIPYDSSDQTVAPLVTHRPLATLSAERQKGMVEEFPSLNGTVSISSDGLGQTISSTDQNAFNGICAVLWEEEATICLVVELSGIAVTRRCDNNMINGTKLLNSAIVTRGRRDGILKGERVRHVVKVGGMEFKGVWIPFERALEMARREQVLENLYPLFIANVASILYSPSNLNRLQQLLDKGAHRNPRFLEWIDGMLLPKNATSINSSSSWLSSSATKASSTRENQESKPFESDSLEPKSTSNPKGESSKYSNLLGAGQTSMK